MITLEEACRIAYEDHLRGMKYTRIKDTGDSFIICYVTQNNETMTGAQPYRISKENGKRLPFAVPSETYFDMFKNAADVEVPKDYR